MVAAVSLANLRKWKPGESGFKGRSHNPLPEDLRGIASLTRLEILKVVSKYARMTGDEVMLIAQSGKTPLLECSIANIFLHSIKNGDYARLAFLLEQALGKVPTSAVTDEEAQARRELQELSDHELIKLVKAKLPDFEEVSR